MPASRATVRRACAWLTVLMAALVVAPQGVAHAEERSYIRIEGSGSTWSANALDQWRRDIKKAGVTVDYAAVGSTAGRTQFSEGVTDFGVSEIPFQFNPENPAERDNNTRPYAYMPVVAGGTAMMYNLTVAGQRITNLRLSGATITKIFTGVIRDWSDPAITADYGVQLPAKPITPILRSDGSGTSAQFTRYMATTQPALWQDFCNRTNRSSACGMTSNYPSFDGAKSLNGSIGVSSYISADYGDGAIGYVEYSYALNAGFPVVKVLNSAGYYTEPTQYAVAVALLQARINDDESNPDTYLTQNLDNVYTDADPRTYPMSSYSYMIIPTSTSSGFDEDSGYTLADFAYYFLCQGQQQAGELGYSPLPVNLVQAGFEQVLKIPGADPRRINVQSCNNPTFNPDGSNKLAEIAPMPADCDKMGAAPCTNGTGGASGTPTQGAGGAVPETVPGEQPAAEPGAESGIPGTDAVDPPQGGATDQPMASGVPGTGTGTSTTKPTGQVQVPKGATVAEDGSLRDEKGKVLAEAGTVKAPAGSTVTSDGNLVTPEGETISGTSALAGAGASSSTATGTGGVAAASTGELVTLGGDPGLVQGAAIGAQPVAANVALGPVEQGGTTTVLMVLAALALAGAVVVPPLLARGKGVEK